MPKGVYVRTDKGRENMSRAAMGRLVWNKGLTQDDSLINQVNRLMSTGQVFTIGRIFNRLVAAGIIEGSHQGYKRFIWHLAKARAAGRVDSSRIIESRGRKRFKGGGVRQKFNLGDKVRIIRQNGRTPEWLREELRLDTPRTIIDIFQAPREPRKGYRGTLYYLGSNKMGNKDLESYGFRVSELMFFEKGSLGRPSSKRRYNRFLGNKNNGDTHSTNMVVEVPSA